MSVTACYLELGLQLIYDIDASDLFGDYFAVFTIYGMCWFSSPHLVWARSWENLFLPYANNKGADQPVHLHSLISAFTVCCLVITPLVSISKISNL